MVAAVTEWQPNTIVCALGVGVPLPVSGRQCEDIVLEAVQAPWLRNEVVLQGGQLEVDHCKGILTIEPAVHPEEMVQQHSSNQCSLLETTAIPHCCKSGADAELGCSVCVAGFCTVAKLCRKCAEAPRALASLTVAGSL